MSLDPIYFQAHVSWGNDFAPHRRHHNYYSWNNDRTIIDDILWRNGHRDVLKSPSFWGWDAPFHGNNHRNNYHNRFHTEWAFDNWGLNNSWHSNHSSRLVERYSWNNHHGHNHHHKKHGWNPWILCW